MLLRSCKCLVWEGALGLSLLGCHAPAPTRPESPRPGVPSVEVQLLKSMHQDAPPYSPTPEHVVDLQRLCSKEHWAACVYAGTMYFNGAGVAQNQALAEQLLRRGCTFGSMVGCTLLAGFSEDSEQAVALLELPCARGFAVACANLALRLAARGREADIPRAAELLAAACAEATAFCAPLGMWVGRWKLVEHYPAATTQLQRACEAKEQEACEVLASAYEQGSLGSKEPERALALYDASCKDGHHHPACDALGHMYVLGSGHEKDEAEGMHLFYVACGEGYGPACVSMGHAMEQGWGVSADATQAVPYYERACELGTDAGCQRASELSGKKKELQKLPYRPAERRCTRSAEEVVDLQRRCSKEHSADCLSAGAMYHGGCGVVANRSRAEELYHRACAFGSMQGCVQEARFVRDSERALALLDGPCARGDATACGNTGILLHARGREADVPRASRLLKVACHDDDAGYCRYWAELVIQRKLEAEYQDAQRHLERACQDNQQDACELLASAYAKGWLGATDLERSLALYTFSCGQRHLPSCDALGHMYLSGRGREQDEVEGIHIFYGTCIMGYGPACTSLGRATEEGRGAPADSARAVLYYQRACAMGHEPACQRARELGAQQ